MSRPDLMPLAVRERGELLALLRELTPAQWDSPTLCTRWSVRQVALTDGTIHHQDIRRALGIPRTPQATGPKSADPAKRCSWP